MAMRAPCLGLVMPRPFKADGAQACGFANPTLPRRIFLYNGCRKNFYIDVISPS